MAINLIDQQYQHQLSQLHQGGKFDNGYKAYPIVKDFLLQYQPTTLLDFGCGQGGLIRAIVENHANIKCDGYDPGNKNFNQLPSQIYDAVVSTDAIEHIEPVYLDETLRTISNKIGRCGFFRIACYPAKKQLPDGRNAHLIVKLPEWWREKILTTMDVKIVWEKIEIVDKTAKWPHVLGHNYDMIVQRK
jgi:cyclopropane fatty-acyl-phospholipid synthase-like methyltransferase